MISFKDFESMYTRLNNFKNVISVFEKEYDKNLRWGMKQKHDAFFLEGCDGIWMFVGNKMIGETFWSPFVTIKEDGFDVEGLRDVKNIKLITPYSCYINGTTIIKDQQGLGYGKMLKIFSLGYLKAKGFKRVYGHAREGRSIDNSVEFGAKILSTHSDWAGTGETYYFYLIEF